MKTIKVLLVSALLVCSSMVFAHNTDPVKDRGNKPVTITSEIVNLLDFPYFIVKEEKLVNVLFTVNKDKEIVVLSVDSDSEELVHYIRQKLNYSKVSNNEVIKGKTYLLPVKFVPFGV
ncbi:hypothetical protein [Flavivirga sp. 57AJ16]|uniref:hypothetical protein n=1 Tax=Flavivirga sp. 57AJ16 TaxID=3025307 RepID=UPI0023670B07|nr:hypothetical protein [Flavivirga sp. 57AJ16]MDD7884981.1 hypothetical protein [Flavivirga sp. 57AJ16]